MDGNSRLDRKLLEFDPHDPYSRKFRRGPSSPNADEVIYVIKGRAEVRVDGEPFSLDATDSLAIPGGLPHQIRNPGTEELELILCYSTGDRAYEPEINAGKV